MNTRRRKNQPAEEADQTDSSPEIKSVKNIRLGKDEPNMSKQSPPITLEGVLDTMKQLFEENAKKMNDSENRLKSVMEKSLSEISEKVKQVEEENVALKKENQDIKWRLRNIERESKRNNVVFSGLTFENPRDGYEELDKIVERATKGRAKVSGIRIINTKAQGKKIVARCNTFEEKITILQSKKEMKSMERGTPVYVDDDLPKEDRETQAKIRNEAKKRRDEGSQVKVAGTRMKIDNIWYRWNELTNQPEPFRNQARGTADRDILEHPGSQK